jgi:hypothetical protein
MSNMNMDVYFGKNTPRVIYEKCENIYMPQWMQIKRFWYVHVLQKSNNSIKYRKWKKENTVNSRFPRKLNKIFLNFQSELKRTKSDLPFDLHYYCCIYTIYIFEKLATLLMTMRKWRIFNVCPFFEGRTAFCPLFLWEGEFCDACMWSHGHILSNLSSMRVCGRTVENLYKNNNVLKRY